MAGECDTNNRSDNIYHMCVCVCVPSCICTCAIFCHCFYLLELILTFTQTHLPTYNPTSWRYLSSTWLLTSSPFGSECWLGQVVNKNHSHCHTHSGVFYQPLPSLQLCLHSIAGRDQSITAAAAGCLTCACMIKSEQSRSVSTNICQAESDTFVPVS